MTTQKIMGRDIKLETVDSSNIKDGSIKGEDIANGTITIDKLDLTGFSFPVSNIANNSLSGEVIINGTLTGSKIAQSTIQGGNIVNCAIQHQHLALSSVGNENIIDKTITSNKIADNTINMQNINWSNFNYKDVMQSINYPQGNYWKIYGEDIATSTATISSGVAVVNSFYLPYPVLFNYFTFVISIGRSGAYERVGLYDVNGSRIWESGNLSATTGVMKITGTCNVLYPGQYFIVFDTSNSAVALLSDGSLAYATIPQRGTITNTYSTNSPLPATLNLSNIVQSTQAQPWFIISKY